MMEAMLSSETSFITRTTRRHIPEDDIVHSHRRKDLRSYIVLFPDYTVSPPLWLWWAVFSWHGRDTKCNIAQTSAYQQRLTHWASVNYIRRPWWIHLYFSVIKFGKPLRSSCIVHLLNVLRSHK
jgi:hypothetical protein